MSTKHKNARESRRPLTDYADDGQNIHNSNTHSAQTAGTKRLYSNRESRLSISSEDYGENYNPQTHDEGSHSGKRYRASDWPLSSAFPAAQPPPSRSGRRKASDSPAHSRPVSSQRPSKFVEGSMNDRVSQMPPMTYLGEEELRERFESDQQARGRKLAGNKKDKHHSNGSIAGSTTNQSDVSRHSSIFRFGKSIAASFNPSNWKIFSKEQQQEEETEQHKILRERQEKAEKIYQELKKTGRFRDSQIPPTFARVSEERATPMKHDSALSRQSGEMTRADKRKGRVFLETPLFKNSDSPPSNVGSAAPSSARKSSFHFKRPSLSNIRKSRDQGSDAGSIAGDTDDYHQARRVPSRKDLQKQQKLVKRVSGLELKLDAARRQLAEALGEPTPAKKPQPRTGRPRFIPGALTTLPSERLLSGYVSSEPGDSIVAGTVAGSRDFSNCGDYASNIGRAFTTEDHGKEIMNGAKTDSHELEGDMPDPWKKNKPLPKAPSTSDDIIMVSVESDDAIEQGVAIAVAALEAEDDEEHLSDSSYLPAKSESEYQHQSTKAGFESDYSSDESESIEEPIEEPEPEVAPKKSTPKKPGNKSTETPQSKSNKRKSVFEREGDRSGTYRPPPTGGSESSITTVPAVKKAATKKAAPRASARPHKLQKVTHDEPAPIPSPQRPRMKGTPIKNTSRTGSAISRQGSKLTKTKIPHPQAQKSTAMGMGIGGNDGQSMSSPPSSSSFSGPALAYAKRTFGTRMLEVGRAEDVDDEDDEDITKDMNGNGDTNKTRKATEPMYTAIPGKEGNVPPMPKLPRAVELPSGEYVSVKTSNTAPGHTLPSLGGNGGSLEKAEKSEKGTGGSSSKKLTKSKPVENGNGKGKKGLEREDSFDFARDTF